MREIRFRAWNKVTKMMVTDVINNCEDSFDMVLKHPQIYEVMQYTNFKDIHKTYIYEGDILNISEEYSGSYVPVFVAFSRGQFMAQVVNKLSSPFPLIETLIMYEIIGNIYGNKEMIENS